MTDSVSTGKRPPGADDFPLRAGDIVLVQHQPGWTTAVVVGKEQGTYYYLPKEYEWSHLEKGEAGLYRAHIDEGTALFLARLGTMSPGLVRPHRPGRG